MPSKRKRNPLQYQTSGSLDEETNQRSAFPQIDNNSASESLEYDIPLDGLDYLATVREEARKLVPFVAARREPETRETIPLRKLEIEADKKSFDPFLRYLLNIIDKEGERLEQYMESSSLDASILPKDLQQWRVYIEHKAPCWAILAVVDLATVLEILESLSSWLEKDAIDLQSQWIFCFCYKLPELLNGEDISTLRSVLKSLRSTHTSFPALQMSASALQAVLVYRYGQKDLFQT